MATSAKPADKSLFHATIPEVEHYFAEINGFKMHYVSAGKGPLLLMVHGFPEFWYSWRFQIPVLAKHFRVVAPDLRGYNDSEKPSSGYDVKTLVDDLIALIEHLGYEKAVVMAHDWGGMIAWSLTITHPERVNKLIMLNMPHPAIFARNILTNPAQLLRSWYVGFFQIPFLPEQIMSLNDYQFIETAFKGMAVNKQAFDKEVLDIYKKAIAKPGAKTAALNYYRNLLRSWTQIDQKLLNRKIKVPTLMIWGEKDTALGKETTVGTEKLVEDFTIHYISNASHWVQQEVPDQVNKYILDWLNLK
jgi:epoxide hydrolase 4